MLQKRNNFIVIIGFVLEMISVIVCYSNNSQLMLEIFLIIQAMARAYSILFIHPYYQQKIQSLSFQCSMISLLISIVVLTKHFYNLNEGISLVSVFCMIPLGSSLGRKILDFRIEYILSHCYNESSKLNYDNKQKLKTGSFIQFDVYCRYLISNVPLFFSEYSLSPFSIIFEQIISDHLTTCTNDIDCFCQQSSIINQKVGETEQFQRETFLGSCKRKQFLDEYIHKIYLNLISKDASISENTDAYFSYFSFLSEIVQNQNVLFLEIQKYKTAQKYRNINIISQTRFELQMEMVQRQYSDIIKVQQSSLQDGINSIYSIISYDEKLNAAEKTFSVCIQKKKKLLNILCEPEFALNVLQLNLQDLYDSRAQLNELLKNLVEYQCYSAYLRSLCEAYQQTFKFDSKLVKQIRKTKKSNYNSKIPLYSEDSCAVFISLLNNTLGNIVSVSKNFFDVTQIYTNDQCIGKNIEFLIPRDLTKQHEQLLQGFVKKEKIDLSVLSKPLLIGQDKDGWAMPYEMKFQLTFLDKTNELGLSCWIRHVNDENLHILTDLSKNLNMLTMSSKLFQNFFSEKYTQQNFKKIQITKWIPLLQGWDNILENMTSKQDILSYDKNLYNKQDSTKQDDKIDIYFDTIMLKPYKHISPLQINPDTVIEDLEGVDLYKVSIQLHFVQTIYIQYLTISFSSIEPLLDYKQKQEYINQFQQNIEEFNINFNKNDDLFNNSSINQIKSLQHLQTNMISSGAKSKFLQFVKKCFIILYIHQIYFQFQESNIIERLVIKYQLISCYFSSYNQTYKIYFEIIPPQNYKNTNINIFFSILINLSFQIQLDQNSFLHKKNLNQQIQIKQKENSIVKKLTNLDDKNQDQDASKCQDQFDLKSNVLSERQIFSSRQQLVCPQNNQNNSSLAINYTQIQLESNNLNESSSFQLQPGTLAQLVGTIQQLQKTDKQFINQSSTFNLYDELESPIKIAPFDSEKQIIIDEFQQGTSNNYTKQISTNVSAFGIMNKSQLANNFNDSTSEQQKQFQNLKNLLIKFKSENENQDKTEQTKKKKKMENVSTQQLCQIDSDFISQSISEKPQRTFNKQTSASGVSSINSERQILTRFITKNSGLTGIQVINILGGITLLVMGILTFLDFLGMDQRLKIDRENFVLVNWLSGINSVLANSNADIAALSLVKNKFYLFPNEAEKDIFLRSLKKELIVQNSLLRHLINQMSEAGSQDQVVFQKIIGNNAKQVLFSGRNESLSSIDSTFVYELITQTAFVALQNYLIDPNITFQKNAELNYQPLNSLLFNVTQKIDAEFQQRQIDQNQTLFERIVIFASISLVFALSVVPTYRFIMNKQSEILKLFATIEPEKMNIMVKNLQYCQKNLMTSASSSLYKQNKLASQTSIKSFNNSIKQLNKKKNINSTIPLKLSYLKITVIVIVFFICLQIQPVTDYVISSQFFQNCKDRYKLVLAVMDMQSIMNELIQGRQNIILSRLYPHDSVLGTGYYATFAKWRNEWTNENLIRFQDIQNTKEQNEQYEKDLMVDFFYNALEVNACEAARKYSEYYGDVEFKYNNCMTTAGAVKAFVSSQSTFYELTLEPDDKIFEQSAKAFYKGTSVTDRFNFRQQLKELFDIVINFLKDVNTRQYNQQIMTQKIFIVWQIVSILIVFFFGFLKYSIHVEKKIHQTKEYLNLIEMTVLENNPYIHSFLKQNS